MEKWLIKNVETNAYYCFRFNGPNFSKKEFAKIFDRKEHAERMIKIFEKWGYDMKNCIPVQIRIIYEEIKE